MGAPGVPGGPWGPRGPWGTKGIELNQIIKSNRKKNSLIKIKYTYLCGSQINEIDGKKGKDKYMKYFNSTLVAEYIINKTLGSNNNKKFYWDK